MTWSQTECCNGWQEDKGPSLVMTSWRSVCSTKIIRERIAFSQANLQTQFSHSDQLAIEAKDNKCTFHSDSSADISRGHVCLEVLTSQKHWSSPDFSLSGSQSLQVPNVLALLSAVMTFGLRSDANIHEAGQCCWLSEAVDSIPATQPITSGHLHQQWQGYFGFSQS